MHNRPAAGIKSSLKSTVSRMWKKQFTESEFLFEVRFPPLSKGLWKFLGAQKCRDTCSSQHDYATELINLYLPSSCVLSYFCLSWQFLGLLIPSPAVWAVPRVILGQDRGVPWAVCTVPLLRLLSILSFAECHHQHVHCHWGLILGSVLQLQLQRSPQCPVSQNSCVSHRKLSYISSVH